MLFLEISLPYPGLAVRLWLHDALGAWSFEQLEVKASGMVGMALEGFRLLI